MLKLGHSLRATSYESLGLVASLTPTASGGAERALSVEDSTASTTMEVERTPDDSSSNAAGRSPLRAGFGRIIRDENGNVVDVQLPDGEATVAALTERLIEDIPDPSQQDSLAAWVKLGTANVPRSGSVSVANASGMHVVESEFTIDVNQSFFFDEYRYCALFVRS